MPEKNKNIMTKQNIKEKICSYHEMFPELQNTIAEPDCPICLKYYKPMPNSLPSQQIEEIVKRLKDQYALFVRRDTHGVEEELYPVDIAKVLKQELEACAESAYKAGSEFKEKEMTRNALENFTPDYLPQKLLKPKECKCHCHCSPQPCPTTRLEKSYCKHCKPKGEDK